MSLNSEEHKVITEKVISFRWMLPERSSAEKIDSYFGWRFLARWVAFANFIHTTLSLIVILLNTDIDGRERNAKFGANYEDEGPLQIIAEVWPALVIVVFSTVVFVLELWATLNLLSATEDVELGAYEALKNVRSWRNTTIFCIVLLTAKNVSCIIVWCPIYVVMVVTDILARGLWLTIVYMFNKELQRSVGDSRIEKARSADAIKEHVLND